MNENDFFVVFKVQLAEETRRATDLVLQLDDKSDDERVLQGLMREFHTIKGAASAIQFDEIKQIAHCLEGIYQAILDGQVDVRAELVDLTLFSIDLILELLDQALAEQSLSDVLVVEGYAKAYLSGTPFTLPMKDVSIIASETHDAGAEQAINGSAENKQQDQEELFYGQKHAKTYADSDAQNHTQNDVHPHMQEHVKKDQVKSNLQTVAELNEGTYNQKMMDQLFNLAGEITVANSTFEPQRQLMHKIRIGMNGLLQQIAQEHSEEIQASCMDIVEWQSAAVNQLDILEHRMRQLSENLEAQVMSARLVPLDVLFSSYPRIIRDLSLELNKSCELLLEGQQTRIDRAVLERVKTPLLHIIRNALDHGIEPSQTRVSLGKPAQGKISISVLRLGGHIEISVSDDGTGIDMLKVAEKVFSRQDTTEELWQAMTLSEQQQFLFLPGFSTAVTVSEISGRGVGLDIVKTAIEKMKGQIQVSSQLGEGTCITLFLPVNLSLTRCMLVKGGLHSLLGMQYYAVPMNEIESIQPLNKSCIHNHEGQKTIRVGDESLTLFNFCHVMGLLPLQHCFSQKHVMILNGAQSRIAVLFEEVVEEQSFVSRPLEARLGQIQNIDAVVLLRDGNMALQVDVKGLCQTLTDKDYKMTGTFDDKTQVANQNEQQTKAHILVVEDSQTVREVEKHFLEKAGHQVSTAVDGVDGMNKLQSVHYDLVITDIDMPRMNGIDMIKKIRSSTGNRAIPIIVVSYKDNFLVKQQAFSAGASDYVVKSDFDSSMMLDKINSLMSEGVLVE